MSAASAGTRAVADASPAVSAAPAGASPVSGPAREGAGSNRPASISWEIEPSFRCLWADCATFRPSAGGVLEQRMRGPVALRGPGTLELPEGETELRRGDSILRFPGPARLFIAADGTFVVLSTGEGAYRHPPGQEARFRVLLPALIAGTEGTAFRYVIAPDGTVFLEVTEARVVLRWIDGAGQPIVLEQGMGLIADDAELGARAPRILRDPDEVARMRRELEGRRGQKGLSSRGIEPSPVRCGASLKPMVEDPVVPAGPAELFGFVSAQQARCTPAQNTQAALELMALFPKDPLVPRALYQAWLQARASGSAEDERRLADALVTGYGASSWTRSLYGVSQAVQSGSGGRTP